MNYWESKGYTDKGFDGVTKYEKNYNLNITMGYTDYCDIGYYVKCIKHIKEDNLKEIQIALNRVKQDYKEWKNDK